MNVIPTLVSSIFALFLCHSSLGKKIERCTVFLRTTDEGYKTTYIYDRRINFDFNTTVKWCDKLGGNLPIVRSDDDWNILKRVLATGIHDYRSGTWMGRKAVSLTKTCSKEWLDNTLVDITVNRSLTIGNYGFKTLFKDALSDDCRECEHDDCCAMYFATSIFVRSTVSYDSCETHYSRVCVIPGDYMSRFSNPYELLLETECENIQGPVMTETLEEPKPISTIQDDEKQQICLSRTKTLASFTGIIAVVTLIQLILVIVILVFVYKFFQRQTWNSKSRISSIGLIEQSIKMNDL